MTTAVATDAEGRAVHAALLGYVGRAMGEPAVAKDAVNEAMIRHWCDVMGDDDPRYHRATAPDGVVVAPPTMLQAWTMAGLRREPPASGSSVQDEMLALLDAAGFGSVVATNCEQEYRRYLVPGDVLTETSHLEAVSELKHTALGDGFFLTTVRSYRDQHGEEVGTMRFRIFRFRPRQPPAVAGVRPRPAINADNAFFWEGARARQLRLQRCTSCDRLRHPPTPLCPDCRSDKWDVVVAAGTGTIYSYVVHHHPPVPGLTTPFVVAVVALTEGPRAVGNVLHAEPAEVTVGATVRLEWEPVDDELVLPQWVLAPRP